MISSDQQQYADSFKCAKAFKNILTAALPILSLLIVLIVFWWLKMTGITLAGEAFCGKDEHIHNEACTGVVIVCTDEQALLSENSETAPGEQSYTGEYLVENTSEIATETIDVTETATAVDTTEITETVTAADTTDVTEIVTVINDNSVTEHVHTDSCYEIVHNCELEEHVHISSCYSDITADLEDADDWEATLADISPYLSKTEKIIAVAESQLGYAESELNFIVDSDEVRHGYTRYGEWYGNPYGDWSVMFTSFCLRYAGLEDVPINSGADAMRLLWEEAELYSTAAEYTPIPGDIVFLDKNGNGTVDTTAIVTDLSNGTLSVIEGDLENKVAESAYDIGDTAIIGYGTPSPGNNLISMSPSVLADGQTVIAKTEPYTSDLFAEEGTFVVYAEDSRGNCYAFDGNGNAVLIYIDSEGNITSDVDDPNTLYWSFTASGDTNSYLIQNLSTGRYMHAYPNNGTGVTTAGAYPSLLIEAGSGVQIKSNSEFARLVVADSNFQMTQNQNQAAVYNFGKAPTKYVVWLDGTNGGLMGLGGSPNNSYIMEEGAVVKLPEEWQSPEKYSYTLQGWFDIKNNKYYQPGAEMTVTGSTVLYADWFASDYDVGQNNSLVSDTVSTDSFITTKIFDYNSLFNLRSETASVSATPAGHSETWNMVTSGTVPYLNGNTLDFIFCDYDLDGDISYPFNRNGNNINGTVYPGIYTEELGEILFATDNSYDPATGEGILGKKYIGEADHLFHFDSDPESENCGYYYYDSKLNAASYNQSDSRFYVYDYLERTADSEKDGGGGAYSDFLPFNSPYTNMNGNTLTTYTYDGDSGEYAGVTHYQYDAKYDTYNNTVDNVGTNYWFGMSLDIKFYLMNDPGTVDSNGNYGNQDLYGNDMCFKFSGDDDVWIFIDGKSVSELVLDIGGVHGIESGEINFSTGIVTLNGEQVSTLSDVSEGEHTLTVYYLERGSSQSNCAIYFNLTPRYSLNIQKEDVITRELLNGAEFTVYSDIECTVPADLWVSKEAHDSGEPSVNVFTVENGSTTMWGLVAGKTYYIKETKPPDVARYSTARGIICLSLDYRGGAAYSVEIIEETDENGNPMDISGGYTVHGFRIDEETQQAYIVVTNAYSTITETTSVQALKEWNDTEDHTLDSVTVYMTVTYPDGTVKRIRETVLNEENGWTYTWVNLPKYDSSGVTEIIYGVEEAYKDGYSQTVEKLDRITVTDFIWAEAGAFENGETYILKTTNGCLSTTSDSATTLSLVDEETAKSSPLALWTATVSGNSVKFTNGRNQVLTYTTSGYFYAVTSSSNYQNMVPVDSGTGFKLYCTNRNRSYYIGSIGTNGRATATTNSNSGLIFAPMTLTASTTEQEIEGFAFRITNTPLEEETSLKVIKIWDTGLASASVYEDAEVTVKLLANGIDTGRAVTLSFKNGWTDTFLGLPYTDADGNVITYSVEESWDTEDFIPSYGELRQIDGDIPTYEITVTNTYKWGYGYELPSTGGFGQIPWILGGLAIMTGSLVYGYISRRKRERRSMR